MREPMTLSDAIRLGAMLKPQGYAFFFDDRVNGTCAMGAALDACGRLETSDPYDNGMMQSLADLWPFFPTQRVIACVAGNCHHNSNCLFEAISHLNDDHHWTRQQVADWVQTIEPARDTPVIEQPADQGAAVPTR